MSDDFVFVENDPTPLLGTCDPAALKDRKKKREMLEEAKQKAIAEMERESLLMDELAPEYLQRLAVLTERFYREKIAWWKQREEETRECVRYEGVTFDEKKGYLVSKPTPEQERQAMESRCQ